MTYDPAAHGARCDLCVLSEWREGGPVAPEVNAGARALVVGKEPGVEEVRYGRPYVGKAGSEAVQALGAAGLPRDAVSWDNALACQSPANNYDLVLTRLRRLNEERAAKGQPPLPTPLQCCRPRVQANIRAHAARGVPNVLTFGRLGTESVTWLQRSIVEIRGGPVEGWLDAAGGFTVKPSRVGEPAGETAPPVVDTTGAPPLFLRVLPTLDPAFVLRSKRWRHAYRADVAKAFRWFRGELRWRDPRVLIRPTPEQLHAFLYRTDHRFLVHDLETDDLEPLWANVRCVGIGTDREVVVVPLLSIDGTSRFYDSHTESRIIDVLKRWYEDPSRLKASWNGGYYDRLALQAHLGIHPVNEVDGIMLAKNVWSELPKRLGYAGSILTDVRAWKADHTATQARTDRELQLYCAIDVATSALCVAPLWRAIEVRDAEVRRLRHRLHAPGETYPTQQRLLALDHELQAVCAGLHTNGMWVDQTERGRLDADLLSKARASLKLVRDAAGQPGLNPNSPDQVRKIVFDGWGLLPGAMTDAGVPSVNDDTIRAFIRDPTITEQQRAFFTHLRWFRRWSKYRGTFVLPIRPRGTLVEALDLAVNEEALEPGDEPTTTRDERGNPVEARGTDAAREAARRTAGALRTLRDVKESILHPDGRMHADWNAHGTTSGRLSSSHINAQNQPRVLRSMYAARLGNLLVYADMDQLELRYASALAGCGRYLDVFAKGGDPHTLSAEMIFGAVFTRASAEDRSRMRDFAKRFTYACAAADTPVAVLDARGRVPIAQLKPGDWTWCWDGAKYAPTRVVNVRCHGVRACVRVTFKWGKQTTVGGERRASVVFTADHRFMLRDGTYRAAGELRPDDRLMPFNRWRDGAYRIIDATNDGARVGEHRAALGIATNDRRHVHHIDECGLNNVPGNLTALTAVDHARRHFATGDRAMKLAAHNARIWSAERRGETVERLAAGRRVSEKWREANQRNKAKMLAGLAAARVAGRGRRGIGASVLDAWREEVGVLPDVIVGARAGVTGQAVLSYRKRRGIPPPPPCKPGKKPRALPNHAVVSVEPCGAREVWDIEVDHPAHNFALADGVFVHNCIYGAQPETIHEVITSVENRAGELVYAGFKLTQARRRRAAWLAAAPEFETWWEWQKAEFRQQGFLVELVTGRRRDFLDVDNENEWTNFPVQSGGRALVTLATTELVARYPFGRWGSGTGLIADGHDSLLFEVPAGEAERLQRDVQDAMKRRVPCLPVQFTAAAKRLLPDASGLSRWSSADDERLAVGLG